MNRAMVAVSLLATGALSAGKALCQSPPHPAPPAATVAMDGATYFKNADLQNIWADLEARQVINRRVLEGGTFSINVRIVKPDSPPWCTPNLLTSGW